MIVKRLISLRMVAETLMENPRLNEFVDAIGPFYPLWQSVRVCGAAININGGWFNIAMQMELEEGKAEDRTLTLVPPDFLHYQCSYPIKAIQELLLETVKNGFLTLKVKEGGGDGERRIFLSRLASNSAEFFRGYRL